MRTLSAILIISIGSVSGFGQTAGTFAVTGSMTTARSGHTATLLQNGKVLIAGGDSWGTSAEGTSAELYDPATRTFAATGNLTPALDTLTATLLADGRVLIVGVPPRCCGYNTPASAELYDPSTGTFASAGSVPNLFGNIGLNYTTATLLNSGKVLVTGPFGYDAATTTQIAELYDPLAGTFTATASMALGHHSPTATPLASGKVLIAEGACGTGGAGGSELYDPASGTFSPTTGNMPCRGYSTATLLPSGKVLIAGGPGDGAEVYDPSTGTFTASAGINAADGYAATLLPDGTVLISGGNIVDEDYCSDESVADAELYDPATGTFGSAGSMTTPRSRHQSTLLADGTVLISGGDALGASAEVYTPPVPLFFSNESYQGSGLYYLQFPDNNPFGYFKYVTTSLLYHDDMGFEAFVPGSAADVYLYDFTSTHWWYTSSTLFPYLYDFTLNAWLYYFPDSNNPGHYTTNPRIFANMTTGTIFPM